MVLCSITDTIKHDMNMVSIGLSKLEHLILFGVVCKGQIKNIHILVDYIIVWSGISELFTDS